MNWTEGNLSRHSKGRRRNELLTRQKQHFAKVRNGLLNGGIKQSPISISFLGIQNSREPRRRDGSNGVAYKQPSSPLLVEKRRRAADSLDGLEHQLSICEKRRRLLDKEDWVGLNLQQPIDIAFPGKLQPLTGSRWAKPGRSRLRAVPKRHESPSSSQLEVSQKAHGRSFKIRIGSQEINPSVNAVSRRYSLAPQPLASSSQIRSNPISSPEPSHARHLYAAPTSSNKYPQMPKGSRYEITGEQGGIYVKKHVKPLVPEEPTYVVHSSSIIHEPIPCRKHNNFMVLNWSPAPSEPEDWGSMQVEIERPARPVPLSQEADQEFWKKLAASSSDNLPIHISTSSQTLASPGSSRTTILPSLLQRRLPSYEISSEPGINMVGYHCPESSTTDYVDTQSAIYEEDAIMLPKQESSHQTIKVQPTDDNSAWMKFVFDDDSEELEAKAFTEAAHQAAVELLPSDIPAYAINSTETNAACGADSFSGDKKEDESLLPSGSSESHMATYGTLDSDTVSSNLATTGSTTMNESESRFRFAQPRTFIGKLADSSMTTTQGPPLLSQNRGKRRGRPKRKAIDGRTDIRQLPDFDGDPIEEFENE
ncbi:hypothetical protein F4781DRAFT_423351 [Annulohypoxylon bovei var. microspora]|nr:hypothetical protein F4781DRAFT_423351 [Annulohypoxylon bovei var. microspora]